MREWGAITWIGVLLLVLVLVIYYKGARSVLSAGSSAFGKTAQALTGGGTGPFGGATTRPYA